MPKPYPQEFRDDVVKVARSRPEGTTLEQIARRLRDPPDDVVEVARAKPPSTTATALVSTTAESAEIREREAADPAARAGERGAAPSSGVSRPGEPPKRLMYPLVRELAVDGIPVTVSCRVLGLARQPYYRWLESPFTDGQLDEA